MVLFNGMIFTTRANVGMIQQNYDVINEVSRNVEAKRFAQCKKITCSKSWSKFSLHFVINLFIKDSRLRMSLAGKHIAMYSKASGKSVRPQKKLTQWPFFKFLFENEVCWVKQQKSYDLDF